MKVLQSTNAKETNFFSNNETLHKILEEMLDKEFLDFAKRELNDFGELVAGEIDERAKTYRSRRRTPFKTL